MVKVTKEDLETALRVSVREIESLKTKFNEIKSCQRCELCMQHST